VADLARRLLDGQDLGVRRGALAQLAFVVGGSDYLAVAHDDGPDGDVIVRDGASCLAQRQAHVVLVVGQSSVSLAVTVFRGNLSSSLQFVGGSRSDGQRKGTAAAAA
jgi:hypothetical protein